MAANVSFVGLYKDNIFDSSSEIGLSIVIPLGAVSETVLKSGPLWWNL